MSTNWNRVFTLFVVGCCLFALTTSASTLDETVNNDPSDAIDPNWEEVPIGKDTASDLKEQSNEAPDESGSRSEAATGDGGGEEQSDASPADSGETSETNSGGSGDATGGADSAGASETQSGDSGGSLKSVVPESLLERLLDMLRSLLANLAVLAGVLLAFVGVGLLARRLLGGEESLDETESATRRLAVGSPTPTNDVSRAWYDLMERFGVADAHQLTPRERAAVAVERGADADVVQSLTGLFEDITYGDAPVTEERRSRARTWLERAETGSQGPQSRSSTTDDGWDR